jgi:hypothetical protein
VWIVRLDATEMHPPWGLLHAAAPVLQATTVPLAQCSPPKLFVVLGRTPSLVPPSAVAVQLVSTAAQQEWPRQRVRRPVPLACTVQGRA